MRIQQPQLETADGLVTIRARVVLNKHRGLFPEDLWFSKKPAAFQNCGQCHKCRRTMMVLASLGALDSFPTFPAIRSTYHFINCRWETAHERLVGSQAITHSMKHRRFGLASAGFVAMQDWSNLVSQLPGTRLQTG